MTIKNTVSQRVQRQLTMSDISVTVTLLGYRQINSAICNYLNVLRLRFLFLINETNSTFSQQSSRLHRASLW